MKVWLSWLECRPVNQKVPSFIPSQVTYLGCGSFPSGGSYQRKLMCLSHNNVNPPLSPYLLLSLKLISMSLGEIFFLIFFKNEREISWQTLGTLKGQLGNSMNNFMHIHSTEWKVCHNSWQTAKSHSKRNKLNHPISTKEVEIIV